MRDAEAEAWKVYAEASCMHDAARGREACELLRCLIPQPRAKLVQSDPCTKPNHVIQ